MPTNIQTNGQQAPATLVAGLLLDLQKLAEQELALAKREVADTWTQIRQGAIVLMAGLVLTAVGLAYLSYTLVLVLSLLDIPQWQAFAIAGGALIVAGVIVLFCSGRGISEKAASRKAERTDT